MPDHVYKLIELVGTSATTVEDAINQAVTQAAATIKNLRWFQVSEVRGEIDNGNVARWQVTLKIGFTVEEEKKS
jgi:dodecin